MHLLACWRCCPTMHVLSKTGSPLQRSNYTPAESLLVRPEGGLPLLLNDRYFRGSAVAVDLCQTARQNRRQRNELHRGLVPPSVPTHAGEIRQQMDTNIVKIGSSSRKDANSIPSNSAQRASREQLRAVKDVQ